MIEGFLTTRMMPVGDIDRIDTVPGCKDEADLTQRQFICYGV